MRRLLLFLGAAMLLATVSVASSVSPPHRPAAATTETMLSTPLPNGVNTNGYTNYVAELGRYHMAIDYDVNGGLIDNTDDVVSVGAGRVVKIFDSCTRQTGSTTSDTCANDGGFGNYVIIRHRLNNSTGPLVYSTYAHLDEIEDGLAEQQCIAAGDAVGELGHTGTSFAEHLHFEINDSAVQYGYEDTATPPAGSNDPNDMLGSQTLWDFCNAGADSDGDSIPDAADQCPDTAGHNTANGCPDADGDGFRDDNGDDQCVGTNGSLNGCPDTDGDGLHDGEDGCPNEVGLSENGGCPLDRFVHRYQLDFDADGIEDSAFLFRTASGNLRLRVVWGSSGNRTTKTNTTAWEFVGFGADRQVDPVGVLDFDDDGYDDVAFLYKTNDDKLRLHVIWGSVGNRTTKNSTTAWELTHISVSDFTPAGIVDFDGDGLDDVAFFHTSQSTGNLLLHVVWGSVDNRTTKTHTTPWQQTGFNDREIIPAGIADFDGDGYDDVLAFWLTNSGNLRLRAIWGSTLRTAKHSEATLWEHVGFGANRELHPAGVLDFDADGFEDVTVFYIAGDGSLRLRAIWGSSGRSPKASHNTWLQTGFGTDRNIVPAGIGDLDGDGYQDVLMLYTTSTDRLRLRAIWGSTGNRTSKVSDNTVDIAPFPEERTIVPAGVNDFDDDGFTDATFFFATATDILRHHAVWGSSGNRSSKAETTTWQLTGFGSTDRLFSVS